MRSDGFPDGVGPAYNDIVRAMYDALLSLNVECDFVPDDVSADALARYDLLVVPAMYCASEETIARIRDYVGAGGHLVASMRSFVADETCRVWADRAPHGLTDVFGMTYSQFTRPRDVSLSWTAGDGGNDGDAEDPGNGGAAGSRDFRASSLTELLRPCDGTTEVLASYVHRVWGGYAAVTRHRYGEGSAEWIGTLPDGRSIWSTYGEWSADPVGARVVAEVAEAGESGGLATLPDNSMMRMFLMTMPINSMPMLMGEAGRAITAFMLRRYAEIGRIEADRTGTARTGTAHAEAGRDGAGCDEIARSESARSESAHTESARAETRG